LAIQSVDLGAQGFSVGIRMSMVNDDIRSQMGAGERKTASDAAGGTGNKDSLEEESFFGHWGRFYFNISTRQIICKSSPFLTPH
jgi:hypothetical protein